MRPLRAIGGAIVAGLLATTLGTAAGPTPGGFTSDDVNYVTYVPFDIGSATGMTIRGDFAYVTSWRAVSIYDISDVRDPKLLSTTPFGFRFENEDVTGNDQLLFFSESLPGNTLHIYDIRNPQAPVEIAAVEGAGDHTSQCVLNCEYVYGSDGSVTWVGQTVDNARNAVLLDMDWTALVNGTRFSNHDAELIREDLFITTPISTDFHLVDVRDPLNPVVLGRGVHPNPSAWLFHSGEWFRGGNDKFLLMQGEQNFQAQCGEGNGPIVLYEVTNSIFDEFGERIADLPTENVERDQEDYDKYPFTVELKDTYAVANGTYQDGSPAVNGLGCSAHWFESQPDFHDGGMVAVGYYEHGTRFLEVTNDGQLLEAGWFLPYGGSTSAAYWVDERTVYAVDYARGIDILKWAGDIPSYAPQG